jgi:REP element-mobilizing transposase RayT
VGKCYGPRIPSHHHRLRVLVAERPARILVRLRASLGTPPLRAGDQGQHPRSLANRPHDRALRRAAKEALRYPEVIFTGVQARAIGHGFANYLERSGVVVWACSILPQHVHLVVARHTYQVEQVANLLKGDATRQLSAEGLHPLAAWKLADGRPPCCWARKEWKVFLDDEADILRAIRYVEQNPLKEGKPPQTWRFVTPTRSAETPFSGEPQATALPLPRARRPGP